MSLVDRAVKAAGGWEKFLYETLKDVYDKVSLNGFTGEGEHAINDAQEVLEAYEKVGITGQPDQVIPTPDPVPQVQPATEVATKAEVVSNTPARRPPKPQNLTCRIDVDDAVGAARGKLPMPEGFRIVNREFLNVTTKDGLELGRGSPDGQVRGAGASGQVTIDGTYRLVFTNVDAGTGLINYTVAPAPATPEHVVRPIGPPKGAPVMFGPGAAIAQQAMQRGVPSVTEIGDGAAPATVDPEKPEFTEKEVK